MSALGARGDLKGSYFGAVDTKIVDLNLIKNYETHAISGNNKQKKFFY